MGLHQLFGMKSTPRGDILFFGSVIIYIIWVPFFVTFESFEILGLNLNHVLIT